MRFVPPFLSTTEGCGYLTLDQGRCVLCLMKNEALAQEVGLGEGCGMQDAPIAWCKLPTKCT